MENKEEIKEENNEDKPRDNPEVDLSQLSEEDRKEVGYSFPKGLLIFGIILLVIIVVVAIVLGVVFGSPQK